MKVNYNKLLGNYFPSGVRFIVIVNSSQVSHEQMYFLMIQAVIPRPIAWVLSDNGGSFNLAPFSFFNAITSEPPILMISVGWKDDAVRKDTWVNIQERSDFVVHIPSEEHASTVVATSAALSHGDSELTKSNLQTEYVDGFRLPRIVGPRIAFFCQKHKIIEIGSAPQALILGEIKIIWMDDAIVSTNNGRIKVDPAKLNPLARLGGAGYSSLGKTFEIKRPS